MRNRLTSRASGIDLLSGFLLLFVGLKLTGHIDWSWWWVLSPIWITALVALVFALVAALAVVRRDR